MEPGEPARTSLDSTNERMAPLGEVRQVRQLIFDPDFMHFMACRIQRDFSSVIFGLTILYTYS
jgi:hypothetical protein